MTAEMVVLPPATSVFWSPNVTGLPFCVTVTALALNSVGESMVTDRRVDRPTNFSGAAMAITGPGSCPAAYHR